MKRDRSNYYTDWYVMYNGEKYSYERIAKMHGILTEGVYRRVKNGWTPKQVVETPRQRAPAPDDREDCFIRESKQKARLAEFGDEYVGMNHIMAIWIWCRSPAYSGRRLSEGSE